MVLHFKTYYYNAISKITKILTGKCDITDSVKIHICLGCLRQISQLVIKTFNGRLRRIYD